MISLMQNIQVLILNIQYACMYRKKPEAIYTVNLFTVWDWRNNTENIFHFIYPYIVWTLYNNHALLLKLTEEISRFKSQLGKMNLKVKVKLTYMGEKKKKEPFHWRMSPNHGEEKEAHASSHLGWPVPELHYVPLPGENPYFHQLPGPMTASV